MKTTYLINTATGEETAAKLVSEQLDNFGSFIDDAGNIFLRGFEVNAVKYIINPNYTCLYQANETKDGLELIPVNDLSDNITPTYSMCLKCNIQQVIGYRKKVFDETKGWGFEYFYFDMRGVKCCSPRKK